MRHFCYASHLVFEKKKIKTTHHTNCFLYWLHHSPQELLFHPVIIELLSKMHSIVLFSFFVKSAHTLSHSSLLLIEISEISRPTPKYPFRKKRHHRDMTLCARFFRFYVNCHCTIQAFCSQNEIDIECANLMRCFYLRLFVYEAHEYIFSHYVLCTVRSARRNDKISLSTGKKLN